MRTRSSRTYANSNPWQNIPFNISNLMNQAPASTTTTTTTTTTPSSSDSEYTPSPPRRRHGTSLTHPPKKRADVVVRNVAILGVVLATGLLFLHIALYVAIFVVGILAPAWQTYKSLEARDRPVVVELDGTDGNIVIPEESAATRNWQAYWILAGMLLALDGLLFSPFLGRFLPSPLYHSLLFTLVTWLTRNGAVNAAGIYDGYVKPVFRKSESAIDTTVDSVVTYVDGVSQQAILAVNEAVAPYARHLEHAAAAASRQIQEQAHAHGRGHRIGGHRRRHHR